MDEWDREHGVCEAPAPHYRILAGNELPCTGSRLQMPAWHHCGCPNFASCTAALELKAGQIRDASVCQERKLNGSNSA